MARVETSLPRKRRDGSRRWVAGLGVAWHAKPVVQLEADVRLNQPSLLHLLYLLGFTQPEIVELSS